jgi:hypothetical protein
MKFIFCNFTYAQRNVRTHKKLVRVSNVMNEFIENFLFEVHSLSNRRAWNTHRKKEKIFIQNFSHTLKWKMKERKLFELLCMCRNALSLLGNSLILVSLKLVFFDFSSMKFHKRAMQICGNDCKFVIHVVTIIININSCGRLTKYIS